ncbi:MAG: DMT family transporter, partial [Desulfobacterales bacterium]|nr:DMT family transporter [Desulfobacterales bacterium]
MVYLKLLLTAFFWGGTFVAGRVLKQNVEPFSAAFLRFAVAAVLLLAVVRHREGGFPRLARAQWLPVGFLGLTGVFAYNAFFFKGLQLISAGRASLVIATSPVLIALFSAWLYDDKLSPVKIVGILLSVTGAMVVISKGNLASILQEGPGFGELMIFGCVLSWVAYTLIGKSVMQDLSPLAATAYAAFFGMLFLCIPAWMEGLAGDLGHYTLAEWTSIIYLGLFGTVIGFVWYYEGIRQIGALRAGLFINFVPVSAIT